MEPAIKASSLASQDTCRNSETSLAPKRRWASWGLLALVLALFFFRLGSYPLFDLDEPRYAEAAREMIERGNWITPYFNYEVRFDKPVFFYWLIMLAYKFFGLSEFSARFFSAVSSVLTVGMVYFFGKRTVSTRFGLTSAAILATSAMFLGIGRMSITDMTLSMLMTGTTLSLFLAAHSNLRWWLAAGIFAGLAVLTKGPVGIIVPGAIFTIYTLMTGNFKRCLFNRWLPAALLLCLAIATPWYVLAYQENGPAFLDALLFHNVTRFSDTVSGHKQSIFFYAFVLPLGFLPWTAYLPAAIRQFVLQTRQGYKKQVETGNLTYLVALYAITWIAFIFVFFTASHTKLITYILPLFPALAILTAMGWTELEASEKSHGWFMVPTILLTISAFVGGILFNTATGKLLPREAVGAQANPYTVGGAILLIAGLAATLWLLHRGRRSQAFLCQVLALTSLFLVAAVGIIPSISQAAQGLMLHYLQITNGKPLIIYEIQRPSLTFYGKRRVSRYIEEQQPQIVAELNKSHLTYVITKNNYLTQFVGLLPVSMRVHILEKDAVYSLLSVDASSEAPIRKQAK